MTVFVYVETSAIVPLVKHEKETAAMGDYLSALSEDGHALVTSRLTETELRRVGHRWGVDQKSITALLETHHLVEMSPNIFLLAGSFPFGSLRSLDALHLAAALNTDCSALISLDERLIDAAEKVGLPVLDHRIPATTP